MAKSQQERSAAAAAKRQRLDETELRHRVRRGTRAMLGSLMRWHGIKEQAKAIQLLIVHAHDLGPEGSAPLLAIPRHDFKPSENVAQRLYNPGAAKAALLDRQDASLRSDQWQRQRQRKVERVHNTLLYRVRPLPGLLER
ncbi:hypothetical protein [Pseudomonas nitroreducens]|uniref:hypothetical protein n=1 Tax=Pseudomonas nitroreducens TaxID=46680 RepID=UPI002658423F|nr:hypothetical protein [Pseudomonas nitroreducens]MCP1651554.1 hypothetical protein [Pseudomonas nitroreducens]MCP1684580.1 hypothetical protein [Pseudomonas nitroreducens]